MLQAYRNYGRTLQEPLPVSHLVVRTRVALPLVLGVNTAETGVLYIVEVTGVLVELAHALPTKLLEVRPSAASATAVLI